MKIQRKRYVVMRKNRTEIWAGNAKHYSFRKLEDVDKVNIVTYFSESKAEASCSSWDRDFEIVPVVETIELMEDVKK